MTSNCFSRIKLLFIALFFSLGALPVFGQGADGGIEMADGLRADGMIWVVVGVLLIVLFGFLFFLWRLERRIDRLEAESGSQR